MPKFLSLNITAVLIVAHNETSMKVTATDVLFILSGCSFFLFCFFYLFGSWEIQL